jgi:serine/threonine-protein kinase
MEIICTRPSCNRPQNFFSDLDDETQIRVVSQRYCTNCGMPLFLADRYIPLRLLGKGGFGAAFYALDRYTPKMRHCVVKQFQPSGNFTSQELALAQSLFEREAEVLEELGDKNPQIPDLYAFFTPIVPSRDRTQQERYFYLAQEFIDGKDLETELAEKGTLSETEVREILSEVLKILDFVHAHDSIHRDIKPSNIMRDRRGVIYLLDFGAVKQVSKANLNPSGKSTGIYSMGFAPPEQMTGGQVYPSTDLYALAATCINCLTGKPAEALYDAFNHRWEWHVDAPQTSDRLKTILDRMLLATPSERFQSAQEVLQALNPPTVAPKTPDPIPPSPLPVAQAKAQPPRRVRQQPPFSIIEILGSAGFTGFEGALIYLALVNWLSVSGVSVGIWGAILGGLIFAQARRIIEKVDLIILSGITVTVIFFLPFLQGGLGLQSVLIIAAIAGAGAIAVTACFRLIYQLLSRLL